MLRTSIRRLFSTSEKWGIGKNKPSASMSNRSSEMKIQYEKAELGKNTKPS